MKLHRIWSSLVALVLVLVCDMAVADPQPYSIRGTGSISCGDAVHTLAIRENSQQDRVNGFLMAEWVWGYIAAYNARGAFGDPTRVRDEPSVQPPDERTVYLFVDGYCHQHPTGNVISAAEALIRSLGGKLYIPKGLD